MSQTALNFAIENAFQFLADQSWELFDAWYEFMHEIRMEGNVEIIKEIEGRHNATNLDLMLACVMPPAWFRPLTNTHSFQMTVTYQRNILSTEYNGWENYETWNVALWINNDQGLYDLAMEVGNYVDFIDLLNDQGIVSTPDGVKYNDPAVNVIQLNSDVFDL